MTFSGRRVPRLEDATLVRGEGAFVADFAIGAKAVRFVRSAVASGTISSIEAPAGTLLVTAADLEDVRPIVPRLSKFNYVAVEQPILARDRVHYVGQPIAAVVADNPAQAEDRADAVIVTIQPDDAIVDAQAAVAPGTREVHHGLTRNVVVEGAIKTAGVDDAFAAAHRVVAFDVRSGRQSALPLETRGGHAEFDKATGRVTLHASVQMPHMLRTGIADCLDLREADLRVVAPEVGGGFGQKMQLFPEYVLLVWLARRHKTRFAWIEDRNENLIAAAHSRDQTHHVRAAFDAAGTLTALDVDILANVGAFSCYPTTCGVEPLMALAEYTGPYDICEYAARARGAATNTCPIAPYRGVSRPVITFAIERLFDRAAKAFHMDRAELRRRNLVRRFPYRTVMGLTLDEGTYVETMDLALQTANVPAFRARQAAAQANGRYLGLGFSVFNERTGYGTSAFAVRGMQIVPGYERVEMAMTPRGDVEVRIGASPHGQGLRTALTQIVADELGIGLGAIRIIHGDTDTTPYGWGTFASRSLVISGGATVLAARALAAKLREAAAHLLQAEPQSIRLNNGEARMGKSASVKIADIARAVYHESHAIKDGVGQDLTAHAVYDPDGTFSNACHLAMVEVDIETGAVTIERYIVAEDAGRLINPLIADGQIHGGVVQGIANALLEEIVYDQEGAILTGSLVDYLPPTLSEVPEIEIHHLHTETEASVLGAKGLGEGGAIGAPAAVVNAICDALEPYGIEIDVLPATPQRIMALLRQAREAAR